MCKPDSRSRGDFCGGVIPLSAAPSTSSIHKAQSLHPSRFSGMKGLAFHPEMKGAASPPPPWWQEVKANLIFPLRQHNLSMHKAVCTRWHLSPEGHIMPSVRFCWLFIYQPKITWDIVVCDHYKVHSLQYWLWLDLSMNGAFSKDSQSPCALSLDNLLWAVGLDLLPWAVEKLNPVLNILVQSVTWKVQKLWPEGAKTTRAKSGGCQPGSWSVMFLSWWLRRGWQTEAHRAYLVHHLFSYGLWRENELTIFKWLKMNPKGI